MVVDVIPTDRAAANEQTRLVWNANAAYWDARMGEGNDFVNVLIRPATARLLNLVPGERVLDLACGNGLAARWLAALGADVVACDFAEEMLAHARARTAEDSNRIDYRLVDATKEDQLLWLGEGSFDAVLCNMALFDMADVGPLARTLPRLLRPGGRFVFSILHPCFNNPTAAHAAELKDVEGRFITEYSMKVWGYMTPVTAKQSAIAGQPEAQLVFHRSLQDLLGTFLGAGMVLDGLEERAFPADHPQGKREIGWNGNFSEIPAVLVARMRPNTGG